MRECMPAEICNIIMCSVCEDVPVGKYRGLYVYSRPKGLHMNMGQPMLYRPCGDVGLLFINHTSIFMQI